MAVGSFWLLLLLPLLLAVFQIRPAELDRAAAVFDLLGRLAAIGGLGCFLLAAALAVRVPGFDRLFGGLTKLWRRHHRLGAAALLLLLAHPLLLAFAALDISPAAAVDALFPGTVASLLGWSSLLIMMVFLAPSFAFFGEPEYQRWKWLHRLSAVSLLLALGHVSFVSHTLPPPWNGIVWGGLAALAVAAVAWRLVFSHRLGRLPYRVKAASHPANNVIELDLEPERESLDYQPGQFAYLTAFDSNMPAGYGEEHPYTLTSAPQEAGVRVAIKDLGDASRAMQTIAIGSRVSIEGPYGDFFGDALPGNDAELWIAGGIGVAPFLSRARELAATRPQVNVQMVYCVQDEARALFHDELVSIAGSVDGFSLVMHFFYREGPLDTAFLVHNGIDLARRSIYICGPFPLLAIARRELVSAGADAERIHSEEFRLL